jgi:NCS1 family nucleobase:cation symporter-1
VPLTVVTGAVATAVLGLPFWWAIVAIATGNAVGGIAMALHAAQGPRLGVPQMLQSRAQFGFYGGALVTLIALVMFLGFFASNLVVGAQAFNQVASGVSVDAGILVCGVTSTLVAIVGYRLVRRSLAAMASIVGLLMLISFVYIAVDGVPAGSLTKGSLTAAGFFGMFAIGAVWQVAYAPYVSDYSRYMPADTGTRGAFWGTYAGCVLSAITVMSLGALVGVAATDENALVGLDTLLGEFGVYVLLGFALATAILNSVNVYCAVLCTITAGQTIAQRWRPSVGGRATMTAAYGVVAVIIALTGQENFLTNFVDFVTFLLYVLIPWSAINLVDYYLVRHGNYDIDALFEPDGGRYGRWNWAALGIYVVGVLVQLPFMVTSFYTGPLADDLQLVDIAWLVGFVVSGAAYFAVARASTQDLNEPPIEVPPARARVTSR